MRDLKLTRGLRGQLVSHIKKHTHLIATLGVRVVALKSKALKSKATELIPTLQPGHITQTWVDLVVSVCLVYWHFDTKKIIHGSAEIWNFSSSLHFDISRVTTSC